jgi:hypothetical protein
MKKKWKNVLKLKLMGLFGYKNVQKIIDAVKNK